MGHQWPAQRRRPVRTGVHRRLLAVALSSCLLLACSAHRTLRGDPTKICSRDGEGQWSIGIFKGRAIAELRPLEEWQQARERSLRNPIISCADIKDVPSSFVADPFLWPKDKDHWYLFYETKSVHNTQGDIGAAESRDGGLTWKHVGIALDEKWHLSYPFLFEHQGKMYMVPECHQSGGLRLYSTDSFPLGWKLDKVLIEEPLIDTSFVKPMTGVANTDGKWYLLTSNLKAPGAFECKELEVWIADDLLGPWKPHPQNPVKKDAIGARMAGRIIVSDGKMYRFGMDCGKTYGHKVHVFEVTTLNSTHYAEVPVPMGVDPVSLSINKTSWNSERHHHVDAHFLNGEWIAVMDGDERL